MAETTNNLSNSKLERSVLAAIIWDGSVNFHIAADGLTPDTFTDRNLRRVYLAMKMMAEEGESIHDLILIAENVNKVKIEDDDHSDKFLEVTDLMDMLANDPGRSEISTNLPAYVKNLVELRYRRKVHELCYRMLGKMNDLSNNADELVGKLLNDIIDVEGGAAKAVLNFGQTNEQLRQRIDDNREGRVVQGVSSGIKQFDRYGGFHPTDLVIVAADSSQGKTAFATSIAMNAGDAPLAYYSMEMTPEQLTARMIAHEAGLSSSRMMFQSLTDEELARYNDAVKRVERKNDRIFFDERSVNTVDSICQSIRYLYHRKDVRFAVVDYLQILGLEVSRNQNREQAVAHAARTFKNLAKELKITVVLLSQLNRDTTYAGSPRPTLQRIRDSGEINESSDLTLLLYRPEVYGSQYTYPEKWKDVDTRNTACIEIAKDRHGGYGGLGSFILGFNASESYFYELKELPRRDMSLSGKAEEHVPWK